MQYDSCPNRSEAMLAANGTDDDGERHQDLFHPGKIPGSFSPGNKEMQGIQIPCSAKGPIEIIGVF